MIAAYIYFTQQYRAIIGTDNIKKGAKDNEGDTPFPPCVLCTALFWHCVLRSAIFWPLKLRTI